MANAKRTCKHCKKTKLASKGIVAQLGFFCSEACRQNWGYEKASMLVDKARKKLIQQKNKEHKARKDGLKSRGQHLKAAQSEFNKFIRLRDKEHPCISCGRHHVGQYHAGHYRSVGSHPELRFEELNVHKQCSACNNFKSGNITDFRINLVIKIGEEKLEWLEGPHRAKHYSIEEIKTIKSIYRAKWRELEKSQLKAA